MRQPTLDLKSFLVCWAILALLWLFLSYVLHVPEYLLASPHETFAFISQNSAQLLLYTIITSSEALVGWAGALVLGLVSGALVYYITSFRRIALPLVIAIQTTPIVALAPLITLWFGYGWGAKVAIAATVAIFPIILATYSGLSDAKPGYIAIFRLAGASELSVFWNVRLRCSWAALIPALKVSIVLAVIGAIVGEFMGGSQGLGFLIMTAIYGTKSRLLLATVILSALIGQFFLMLLELITHPLEKKLGQNSTTK